ncbi:hypothetical protein C8Q72DRAFT_94505 [Fomitopsis betulina]|nr:hypothetical protein C8Q72DRAFT_94505 [Fomitopsis betulina]
MTRFGIVLVQPLVLRRSAAHKKHGGCSAPLIITASIFQPIRSAYSNVRRAIRCVCCRTVGVALTLAPALARRDMSLRSTTRPRGT